MSNFKWACTNEDSDMIILPCLSRSLSGPLGRHRYDLATSSTHSSRLSVFLIAAPSVIPVHSGMLSSHLFFCLPLLRPPCTVPCRIVLASSEDLVMCPYHFSLRLFLWSRGLRGAQWLMLLYLGLNGVDEK